MSFAFVSEIWVAHVSQPVTNKAYSERGQENYRACRYTHPPGGGQIVPALTKHQPEARSRWLHTQAKERQRRFEKNDLGEIEGDLNHDHAQHIGQDVADIDLGRTHAQGSDGKGVALAIGGED